MEEQPLLKRSVKHSARKKTSWPGNLLAGLSIAAMIILINNHYSKTALIFGITLILIFTAKEKNPILILLMIPLFFILNIGEISNVVFPDFLPAFAKKILFFIISFIMVHVIFVLALMYDFEYFSSTKKIKKDHSFQDVALEVIDLYIDAVNNDKPLSLPESKFISSFYRKQWGAKEDQFKQRIYSLGLLYKELIEDNPEFLLSRHQQMRFIDQAELFRKKLALL
ncbi:hypothetical protein AM500_19475 [Bacillus sp. FJAT-18017]|uniref:hypothetical protein n=1 Tax=Bacillus sp. FJAT-18017 TaxID=1705566 RepID=UPI0006AF8B04|nr:hypothetical protein [Bacillus sp. FJAT-18017]ALC91717.1 hypothetical protein AM500_19475 [Bacillus sp. FJAT-18017]